MSIKKLKNYEKIKLLDFSYVKEKRLHLKQPGIYAIFCEESQRAYFHLSLDILEQMDCDVQQLSYDFYEGPKELLDDVKTYGLSSFWFIIFVFGPEWKFRRKCYKEIEKIKENWPYGLY